MEVEIDQQFPYVVQFWNEHGELTEVPVTFEWKPTQCHHCKGMGHTTQQCRIKQRQIVWVPKATKPVEVEKVVEKVGGQQPEDCVEKQKPNSPKERTLEVDQEGFQRALRPIRVRTSVNVLTSTMNLFQVFNEDALQMEPEKEEVKTAEQGVGEPPPIPSG